uniref:3'-5' exonuclease domain-containing protein n=1 Tax=Panagrolaimus sp. ES5 TaxID=591445 RepID=A0AC34FZI1_9BILA
MDLIVKTQTLHSKIDDNGLFIYSTKLLFQNFKHNETSAAVANNFNKMILKELNIFVEKDEIETCHFWKKPYQVITVISVKAFHDFIDKFLIQSKPKIIAIDVEGRRFGQKAVLLQLATDKWACLIDIQELIKKLSPKQWKHFYTTLFGSNITLIGFSFINDFDLLCNTFSFLPTLLKECQGKVLCLQKLSNQLIKDEKCNNLFSEIPKDGFGLAKLAKSVLDYDISKSLQKSNWAKRPLTQSQKNYAVKDVVVVVLIKDEMEKRLKKEYGDAVTEELMKNSYVSYRERIN